MKLEVAIDLIKKGIEHSPAPQRWADLGAGTGLFTRALGSLLPEGSSITAVDQNASSLKSIEWNFPGIELQRKTVNFTNDGLADNSYDGLLMANSLHYVPGAQGFLQLLKSKLSVHGRLIIVEYERRMANPWVPYPIRFGQLVSIGEAIGFRSIKRLGEVPSSFDNAIIYSALLTF